MLSSEPGLDAWWNSVVQIMVDYYHAERVTLTVPADPTDIENVPWGQKATFNRQGKCDIHMAKSCGSVPVSKDEGREETAEYLTSGLPHRPCLSASSKSGFQATSSDQSSGKQDGGQPTSPSREVSECCATAEEHPDIPSWEVPLTAPKRTRGKVFSTLQPLDYESDPLIDHNGVLRILERGRAVALTRTYPYPNQEPAQAKSSDSRPASAPKPAEMVRKKSKRLRSESLSGKLSSFLSSATPSPGSTNRPSSSRSLRPCEGRSTFASRLGEESPPAVPTPKYEEYEQAPPSPWSQSPAPSPAVRPEPAENPFFTDAMVDEDTFNPASASPDYSKMVPPEAIGIDHNTWTVLHIPLTHVLLSKPNPSFRLNPKLMEQKLARKSGSVPTSISTEPSPGRPPKEKQAPIAIISILSPLIPYPSHLRHSLEHLSPHLATTFSLARHYTNLETELIGLQKRRPQASGFRTLEPDGRPLSDPNAALTFLAERNLAVEEEGTPRDSIAGSTTSPSDHSGLSHSAICSPVATPGREAKVGRRLLLSPSRAGVEGYFGRPPRSVPPEFCGQRARRHSDGFERPPSLDALESSSGQAFRQPEDVQPAIPRRLKEKLKQPTAETPRRHTKLHSCGADFASTFQSLPSSSTIFSFQPTGAPSSSTTSRQADLTPPSDKLKSLILDFLPVHVFVALPQTGEIVWVNSRFLSYRGLTSAQLALDPWGSIHPDDRDEYLRAWNHSVRTGEQFSRTVRIRRFDGAYRWFYARAVASRDKRGVIMQFLGSYMDIHDQHIAELRAARQEEIEASEAKHRLLANLIPQIIFTATEDEGVTFANEQWLSYTGQSFQDSLGLGFMDFVHPDDLAKCKLPAVIRKGKKKGDQEGEDDEASTPELASPSLTELTKKGVIRVSRDSSGRLSYTTEIRLRAKSGEYRWHLVRCVEIDNVDFGNGVSSYFGSATDINDLKLLETKLKEAMDSKSRFLSNMSHEIRTPLIGISGMVSFLQDTTLNEEQRDYTNTIQTSASSLLMIINDILDLSKVDAGMMKLTYEWFHTRSLIEDVNDLVSTMAVAKRLELNYVVEEDVPDWVKGDRVRIRQVLLNVIGNAIKFTNKGEVFSRCRVFVPSREDNVRLHPNEIMLEFSVIDTGRGFTKAEAELIFKPFSQIDGSSTRQHGGSGLGLVISRQLVELHGGKMEGTAVPGKGSTFTFTAKFGLPTETDHPDEEALMPQPTSATTPGETPMPQSPVELVDVYHAVATAVDQAVAMSPEMMSCSASSELSGSGSCSSSSVPTVATTGRSSVSTAPYPAAVNAASLAGLSQAAKASGQELSGMKLQIPRPQAQQGTTEGGKAVVGHTLPSRYSILIICPQTHSREATVKHIEMTLPKGVPHQITAVGSVDEAEKLLEAGKGKGPQYTHIVINLPSPEEILALMDIVARVEDETDDANKAFILILSDSVQRQAVAKLAIGTRHEAALLSYATPSAIPANQLSQPPHRVTYIYKPVKPARFAAVFDPGPTSTEHARFYDHTKSTAQRLVEDQRQSYVDMERRLGGKGYRVLLVEDNPVNQKVLSKYLKRVGVEVEVASDGEECMQLVLGKGWGYYSLILVCP